MQPLVCLVCSLVAAPAPRTVTLYDVHRTSSTPAVDGKLTDAAWQDHPAIHPMVLRDADTRVTAKVQTRTKLVFDRDALYVGIHMDEPFPETLRASYRQYDGQLWWDDSVELYIEPGCTHKTYYKFMSNPLGTRADWRGLDTPEGFKLLDWGTGTEWSVAAHVGSDYWSLEFRFPWSDLEVEPPKPGDVWTFEVVRFRYAHAPKKKAKGHRPVHEYSSWNVGASFRATERFGNIVFGGSTQTFERLIAQKLAPVFGSTIRVYGSEGEILYTSYAELLSVRTGEAAARLEGLAERLSAISPHVDKKARAALQKRHEELSARLADWSGQPPSASSAEAVAKLLGQLDGLEWSVKYRELNVQLGPTD